MENGDWVTPMGSWETCAHSLLVVSAGTQRLFYSRIGKVYSFVRVTPLCHSSQLLTSPLSSSIVQDITKSCEAGLGSIAFFYFDFKDESKKNARGALSSLLVQLAAQSDAYSEILSALYSEHDAGAKQPSNDALRKCFESMLAIPDQAPIFIVIDALDECPNSADTPSPRENVLHLLEWLLELRCSNLWVSVTSRPEPDIEAVLQSLASLTISLHNQSGQEEDITNYIKWFVNSDPKARKWRMQDKELVIQKLSKQADGM